MYVYVLSINIEKMERSGPTSLQMKARRVGKNAWLCMFVRAYSINADNGFGTRTASDIFYVTSEHNIPSAFLP